MKRLRNLLVLSAFSLLILGLPSMASAQWRNDRNDDDYYGRNRNDDDYYGRSRNGGYGNRNREDRINQIARDFKNAVNRLDDRNRGGNNLQQALRLGDQLDNALRRTRLNGGIQNQWNSIQRDLDTVADYYGYNSNRGRGNSRNNGTWRNNIPFPLPF